jgi:uncharacterized protein YwgA
MPTDVKTPKRQLTKKDWALLVIAAAKPKTLTPLQLQKSLFLLGQNIPEAVKPDFYKFVPHNFGPFAKDVYADVEALKDQGLIDEIVKSGQNWPEYRISQTGVQKADEIRDLLSPNAKTYLDTLVKWVEQQSFQDLLHSVYKAYPEFATKSVFNG